MAPASQKENLNSTALGELKKDDIIRSFVDNQTRFLKTYAAEGRAFLSSWEWCESGKEREAPVGDVHRSSAFETPVLKPRTLEAPAMRPSKRVDPPVENVDSRRQSSPVNASVKRQKVQSPVQRSAKRSKASKENKKPASDSVKPRPSKSKDQAEEADESSGDEHKRRLAERRERKRSRRAVTKPDEDSHSEENNEEETVQRKKKRAKKAPKKESSRIPAGLALMHGFSSTNVGKNRLTMQPNTGLGVFNRGKSSGRLDVANKQSKWKASAPKVFSESQFLSNAKGKGKARRPPPTTVSPSPSIQTETLHQESMKSETTMSRKQEMRPGLCKYRESASREKTKTNRKSNDHLSPTPTRVSSLQSPENPASAAESVTWDIEDDAQSLPSGSGVSVPGKQRNSDDKPEVRSKSRCSVSKDNRIEERSAPPSDDPSVVFQRSASAEPVTTSRLEEVEKRSSSIHPSDSASQIFRRCGAQDLLPALSKYFAKPPSDPGNSGKTAPASPSIVEPPGPDNLVPHPSDLVGTRGDQSRSHEAQHLLDPASNDVVSVVEVPVVSSRHLSPVDSLEQALGAFQELDPSLSFGIRNHSFFVKTEMSPGERGAASYPYLSQDSVLSAQEDEPRASYGLRGGEQLPDDYSAEHQDYLLAPSILSYSAGGYEMGDGPLVMDYSEDDTREASVQDLRWSSLGAPHEHYLADRLPLGSHLYACDAVEEVAEDYADYSGVELWEPSGSSYNEHPRMRHVQEHFGFSEDDEAPMRVDAPVAAPDCGTEDNFTLDADDMDAPSEISTTPPTGLSEGRRCWMTNGQVLLEAAQERHGRRTPPFALETIHGIERDVARNLRDHWRPHRL